MSSLLRRLHVQTFVLNVRRAARHRTASYGYVATVVDDHTLEIEVSKEEKPQRHLRASVGAPASKC